MRALSIGLAALVLLSAPAAALDEPLGRRIPYQGRLEGVTTPVTLIVDLYDAASLGTRVWGPEPHLVTPDAEGRFLIVIGSSDLDRCARQPDESLACTGVGDGLADLDQVETDSLHLNVQVSDGTTTTELTPRQPLFPAFASAFAQVAGVADGVAPGSITFDSLEASVREARAYRRNDILLRFGPCPENFQGLEPNLLLDAFLLSGEPSEGQVNKGSLPEGTNTLPRRNYVVVRFCRCNEDICR